MLETAIFPRDRRNRTSSSPQILVFPSFAHLLSSFRTSLSPHSTAFHFIPHSFSFFLCLSAHSTSFHRIPLHSTLLLFLLILHSFSFSSFHTISHFLSSHSTCIPHCFLLFLSLSFCLFHLIPQHSTPLLFLLIPHYFSFSSFHTTSLSPHSTLLLFLLIPHYSTLSLFSFHMHSTLFPQSFSFCPSSCIQDSSAN